MVTQFLIGRFVHLRTANQDVNEGQGLVEYALILLFVAVFCVAAVSGMGDAIRDQLWSVITGVLIPALGG